MTQKSRFSRVLGSKNFFRKKLFVHRFDDFIAKVLRYHRLMYLYPVRRAHKMSFHYPPAAAAAAAVPPPFVEAGAWPKNGRVPGKTFCTGKIYDFEIFGFKYVS